MVWNKIRMVLRKLVIAFIALFCCALYAEGSTRSIHRNQERVDRHPASREPEGWLLDQREGHQVPRTSAGVLLQQVCLSG